MRDLPVFGINHLLEAHDPRCPLVGVTRVCLALYTGPIDQGVVHVGCLQTSF